MNLLGKFTLALLACGLVPLLLGTLFTHTITKRALEDTGEQARVALEQKAKDHISAVVSAQGDHLNTFVQGLSNEARLLSQFYHLQAMLDSEVFFRAAPPEAFPPDELARMREELRAWYSTRLEKMPPAGEAGPPSSAEYVSALSPSGVALQHAYLLHPTPTAAVDAPPPTPQPADSPYAKMHDSIHPFWVSTLARLGYEDVILVDGVRGEVVYSVKKDLDFGASMVQGPLAESHAARAFRSAWAGEPGKVIFEDAAPYLPANNEDVCFIATPIFSRGEKKGVVLFEFSIERFNDILGAMTALGDSGAVYLVGPDYEPRGGAAKVFARRSEIQENGSDPDAPRLDIEPARIVFHLGQTGCDVYRDAAGHEALIAFRPIQILGVTWALIAQVDTVEAFKTVKEMEKTSREFVSRMLYLSDAIVLVAILVLCFVADYLAKPIVRPIRSTVAILKGMVQGEDALNQRLVVSGKDEVAELSSSFNRFMDKIQVLYGSLEKEVSERKRAQEEVERSQQYYKALIEFAPDVIVVLDADFTARFVSPSFERTFGYTAEEVLGKTLFDKIHPDDVLQIKRAAERALLNPGAPTRSEYRLRHKEGHWIYIASVGTNRLDDASIAGTVINLRDISDSKEADRILREYSATLERDVAERTMLLEQNRDELAGALEELRNTQAQLVMNEKMASLGSLTAGIAHEIKNPLNFVTNFAELTVELAGELEEELGAVGAALSPEARETLADLLSDIQQNTRKIQEHGKRADNIVKTMLLHSRGKKDEKRRTQINELLEEYVQLSYHGMRAQDSTFNIELDLHLDPRLPELDVVSQDLARVFLNILNNGCYAAHERKKRDGAGFHPKLTVSTGLESDRVIIRIRDNGYGIPDGIVDKVFTPFFTTKPAGVGTGLGLSISYDIVVQEHQGELSVQSNPGEYTEFIIALPAGAANTHKVET
ncbi:MAG: PAS domain S-box protein [Candidatus Hydrogenedentes bacterium]|nr:PAS domain S-box protein [Candidatus Hydrogenedentota bacterium]